MQLGITNDMISFLPASHVLLDAASLAGDIEDESSSNLHFLVLIILKLQSIHIFLRSFHFRSVECSRFWIPSEHLLSYRKIGQRGIGPRDSYQCCGCCFVDLTWSTVLIWFRVLDLVSGLSSAQETQRKVEFDQTYRFLFATSAMEVMLHCIH